MIPVLFLIFVGLMFFIFIAILSFILKNGIFYPLDLDSKPHILHILLLYYTIGISITISGSKMLVRLLNIFSL